MDFVSDIAPVILALGVSAIPVVGGVLSTAILSTMRDRNMNTMWFETVSRAGGMAYQHLVQSGAPATDKQAITKAAAVGAQYIIERIPDLVHARDLRSHELIDVTQAELGKLLAQDPSVGPAPSTITPSDTLPPIPTGGS